MISNQTYVINANSPTPVFPYGIQTAVTLKNVGATSVYVTPDPVISGGYEIIAGSTVRWESERKLYAYTQSGNGNLQVLEASVSDQGSIAVSGITTPVKIQGGGEFLASGAEDVPFSGSVEVVIPEPESGQAFPSLTVTIDRVQSAYAEMYWEVYSTDNEGQYIQIGDGVVVSPGTTLLYASDYAFTEKVSLPFTGNYPIKLKITNLQAGTGTQVCGYRVLGSAAQIAVPTTDLTDQFRAARLGVVAGSNNILLPPSHTPYIVRAWYNGTPVVGAAEVYDLGTLGFVPRVTRAMEFPAYYTTNDIFTYLYPGHGMPEFINWLGSTATAYFNLQPIGGLN